MAATKRRTKPTQSDAERMALDQRRLFAWLPATDVDHLEAVARALGVTKKEALSYAISLAYEQSAKR